ncbi:FecR domain-containing protein [Leptospira yasudae]|uniref:FecR domain-containing protein n=1 Tax=Leptospira yasudae TaxID=2202201 RepID=UPI00109107F0|nr:FecR domain-containing protein [Leptospira yasudae]MBW0433907.1 FecR domain-containing protein [Leptospira yasudae]TGM95717.1 iron dicitrate transport regulator FecR [Leptospira yasudae]
MRDRFLSGDRPLLLILIFNIVLFTAVFLYDYTQYGYQGSQKVIGTILYKSNTIQRKYDSEVVWREIETGNSVQNRDTILTSEGSQVKVRLLDGSEIMIAENSMVFIDYLDNRASLEISSGGLQVTRRPDNKDNPSSLGIRSGDGVLKLVEGIVNVEKRKDRKSLEYSILSGSIKADPSNPYPMIPKKSLDGFEKLFPVPDSIQTAASITAAANSSANGNNAGASSSSGNSSTSGNSSSSNAGSATSGSSTTSSGNSANSESNSNYGTYDNGNPNYRSTTGSNANGSGTNSSNTNSGTTAGGNGNSGAHTKSGLKLERPGDANKNSASKQNETGSSKSGSTYDPGDYINKQKYEQTKIQEKSDSTPNQNRGEFKNTESSQKDNKGGGSTSSQEMKKTKPAREWTPEELLKQEKEKRRREREDKEQREFLRM